MAVSGSAKHRMDRILRLQEEIDQIKSDIRDIYAEEKNDGGDKTAMGLAITKIRKRAKDKTAFDEREVMTDVYLSAYDAPTGTRVATHTYAPEAGHVRTDGPVIDYGTVRLQSEQLQAATHSPETANEHPHHLKTTRGDESGTLEGSVEDHGQAAGRSPESQMDGETDPVTAGETAPHSERATVATQGEATEPTSDERVSPDEGGSAAANAGGNDVDGSAPRAQQDPTSKTGEGAASALPAKPKFHLRPNCLDRSNCKSGSVDHCWSCKKAMAEKSEVAA
jgi:uncharacterized protein (UPF0335 family)